jgi:pyruvate dehydrogenase E1 component
MAVIVDHGMRAMLVQQEDVFYYITLMNENYAQHDLPAHLHADVIRGCYRWSHQPAEGPENKQVTLMGSGAILTEVIQAAEQLTAQGIGVSVFSVTSWSELARNGQTHDSAILSGQHRWPLPFVTQQLQASSGPIIAASDYVRAVPESIRAYVPAQRSYTTLGTDGFGRSDTRAALRAYFHVDANSIVKAALHALALAHDTKPLAEKESALEV